MSLKSVLIKISEFFNFINKIAGYICGILVILMTLNVFFVVMLRYVFGISFIWMQETYVWMHAFVFMLGAGYTYLMNEHVRIDIIYRESSKTYKKIINLVGNIIFLIPFLYIIFFYSFPFVLKSFQMNEISREAGGLGMLFILKSSILFFVSLMFIQVISKIITDLIGTIMTPEIFSLVMFVTTLILLIFGFPVAFTLAGSALIFAFLGDLLEIFNFRMLFFFPQRIYGVMINEALVAVPLFIFMGVLLEKTKIASRLLESIADLFGSIRGGLGIGVILVGMLLAASTGIVGATVVTMGMLALPTMLKAGYNEKIATGTICAAGTLGQIIPPSIVLILLAEMLQGQMKKQGY